MASNIAGINAALEKECPICHNEFVLPISIPACNHKFCFICLKGVCLQNMGGCPLCRGPIDDNIFKKAKEDINLKMALPDSPAPVLKRKRIEARRDDSSRSSSDNKVKEEVVEEDEDVKPDVNALRAQQNRAAQPKQENYWLYEGRRNGWWRFDPRTERDIEEAYAAEMPITEITICGSRYIMDFTQMVQYPKNSGLSNKRELKRVDSAEFDRMQVKGVAGVLAK